METVRQRAQTLIWKLQKKYQLPSTLKSFPSAPGRLAVSKSSTSTTSTSTTSTSTTASAPATPPPEEEEERGPRDEWYLVDQAGLRFPLPRTMLFLGNEECDIVVKSETVDKRHAVVTFDHYINRFKIKDLSTANGTYINESRIPEQEYVTLNHMDTVRLGYDSMVYHMEQGSSRGGNAPPNSQAHSHPDPLPAWASGHLARMAECQGCIAEQQIEHTCDAHRCLHQHAAEPSFVEMQRAGSGPREGSKNASLSNTWPKKKVRQFTHVAAVFSDNLDEGESVEDMGEASLLQSQPLPPPQPGSPAFYGEPPGYTSDSSTPGSFSVPSSVPAVDPQLYHRYCHHASTCAELSHAHAVPDYPLPPYPHTCPEHTHLSSPGSGEFPPPPPPFALEAPLQQHPTSSHYPGQAGGCQQCQRIAACPNCCALAQYASKGGLPPSVKQGPGYAPVPPVPFSAVSSGGFVSVPPASFVATATATYGHGPPGTYSVTSSTQGAVMSSYVTTGTAPPGGLAEGRRSMDGDVSGGLLGSSQSGKAVLQTDLQTVKKGTPLYGQPSWWGEEDEEGHGKSPPSKTQDEKATPERAERKSLTPPVVPPPPPPQEAMERPRPTYMEIAATDRPTPPRSFASSLSKDSLFSPESSKLNSPEASVARKHSPPEREGPPQPPSAPAAPLHDVGPGMAFTVEFGPEEGAPRLDMAQSLREFLPAKIRKNFQVRLEKSSSKSSQQAEEESAGSPTRQRARAEEPGGEGRPLRKPVPSLTKPAPPPSKRSSLLAEGVPSLQSADLDTSTDQQTATKSTSQTSSSAKGKKSGGAVTGRPPKSPKSSTTTKPAEGGLHPAQLTDPTSYLIDKMFEGSKGSGAARPGARDKTAANSKYTEHKLYKEAKRYDVDGTANITTASGKKVVPKLSPQKPAPPLPPSEPPPPVPVEPASPEKEVKEEDKTSEAGTYTIENEGDEGDEKDARENIDQVFGIDDMLFTIQRPVIEPSTPQNGLSPTSNEGEVTPEGLIEPDDAMGEAENGEVPRWVSQWAALTKQPSSDSPAMAGQELADSPDSKGSRDKPPNGLNRKRPGTGRRLPSIPTDKSPVSSEYSSRVSGSPLSREVTPHQDPGAGGDAGRSKNVTISNQVNVTQYSAQSSEPTSGRSGSIDTELLLRDTEELMAAMEARMATRKPMGSRGSLRQSSGEASVNESDSDTASNVALVNGDEDYVKPSVYKSPRESLGGRSSSDAAAKPRGGIRSAGLARESFAARAVKNRHSFPAADTVVVSDVLSESEVADTESMRSDLSANSDIESNGGFSRRGSKGKGTGTMSMTRPNRAFALRRARADGGEPETPKSAASTGTGVTGASTRRSSLTSTTQRTGRSTTRSTAVDSAKTETSLGAQIAKRGRENASLTRTDGGRHSLRTGKSGPAQPSSLTAPTVSSQRKSELRNLKSQLKTSSGSKGLSVRGTSARSQSQPGSRSNSPKTAERNAWERRKRYDPMKAVAEAKAKAKQGGRPGSGVSSTSSRKRMTRSASFTNSEELSSRDRYAESADEMSYTSGTETTGSSRLLSSHRRAFLPIHPRHQDPFSADEDDSRPYPHSSQDVSCMLVGLSHASAFTPPLPKSKSPSPDKPPSPLPRLHTLDPSDGQERQHLHNGSSSPQSYDNLIVLSVHQLSSKIMEAMERTLDRLKANNRISETPSPLDDLLSNSGRSEIPAWKAANQDLAGILRHLRRIEQNLKVFDQALFPDDGTSTEASGLSTHRHSQEIQRIRGELAGFHPIHHPRTTMPVDDDEGSPELAQLGDDFY